MTHFGTRIRQARLACALSQAKLAQAMKGVYDDKTVSRAAVAQWEIGVSNGIDGKSLLKIAKILNVDPVWIIFGIEDDPLVDCEKG